MSKVAFASAVLIAVTSLSPTSANALDLKLRCDGVATFPEAEQTSASVMGAGGYASGSATTVRRGEIKDRMLVDIAGEAGRVRLPRVMVPPVNSGGEGGWWPLQDVTISDTEISGRFRLNPLNKPVVRIDRTTGAIEVQGSFKLSFRGACAVAEPEERRF